MSWLKVEKLRLQRESEERQQQRELHYEDRITELQSVIAELRKKIDLRHIDMILCVSIYFTALDIFFSAPMLLAGQEDLALCYVT